LRFLATSDLDDAIEACPIWTSVLSTILSANDIANLISAYILRPDDAENIVDLVMQSLRHRAHPFTKLASGMTRDQLSWLDFKKRHPEISTRISKRVEKIAPLLGDERLLLLRDGK
jgi:hypothetical protein